MSVSTTPWPSSVTQASVIWAHIARHSQSFSLGERLIQGARKFDFLIFLTRDAAVWRPCTAPFGLQKESRAQKHLATGTHQKGNNTQYCSERYILHWADFWYIFLTQYSVFSRAEWEMKLWPTLLMGLVATGAQANRSHERTRRQYDLSVSTFYLMFFFIGK